MEKFITLTSGIIPLPIDNIDTDQIVPARFLKATSKEGFGEHLFYDWRYQKDGSPNPDFVLNKPNYDGCLLVTGENFGSGSSREHAAWALADYGFKAIVSSRFADIFKHNALNNGVLPIEVDQAFVDEIFETVEKNASAHFIVDLEAQTISNCTMGTSRSFEIDAYKKECLLKGYDDIDYLLSQLDKVNQYEAQKNSCL